MQKKGKITLLVVLTTILVLLCTTAMILTNFVVVDWHLYPKGKSLLDLRKKAITAETYETIAARLPGTRIVWNAPIGEQWIPNDSEEITIEKLSDEDVAQLDCFYQLKTVHAEACRDYPQLWELHQRHPSSLVLYQVVLGEKAYPQNAKMVEVPSLDAEQAELLTYLPQLAALRTSECHDYGLLQRLQSEHPDWEISYDVPIAGETFPSTTTSITVQSPDYRELAEGLAGLPDLQELTILNPNAEAAELLRLRQDYPSVEIHWQVHLMDLVVTDDVAELDLSGYAVESVESVEAAIACLPELEKLIMCDCGIDNEIMAAFRERQRENYKVVWTVYLSSKTKIRTDELYFMPIKQGEYYFQEKHAFNLRYCEDMICMDLGHSRITTLDFVEYMPHLQFLVIADTTVQDLTPLQNCKELKFLEFGWCAIRDYTPLLGCTALEDLNISRTFADISPLKEMTWLKHLWCMDRGLKIRTELEEALPDTIVEGRGTDAVAYGWRQLPNYYLMRDILGMPYMK